MSNRLKILISVLTVVSLTIGIIIGVLTLLPDPVPPRHSVLILLDKSKSMNRPFRGSTTKLQAVREQILHYARAQPDTAIALRFTGGVGVCNKEAYEPPTVTFHRDNASEIDAALADVTARGDSDFATAVGEAVNDFDRYEAGQKAKVQSLWVFLGSGHDTCRTNAIEAIKTALEGFGKQGVRFNFFGVGATKGEDNRLRRLVRRLKQAGYAAYVRTPKNVSELRKDVEETSQRETPYEEPD
jgi:hypothetical protein